MSPATVSMEPGLVMPRGIGSPRREKTAHTVFVSPFRSGLIVTPSRYRECISPWSTPAMLHRFPFTGHLLDMARSGHLASRAMEQEIRFSEIDGKRLVQVVSRKIQCIPDAIGRGLQFKQRRKLRLSA